MDADRVTEVNEALEQWFECWKSDSPAAAMARMGSDDDMIGIGTDADEFWVGRRLLEEAVNRQYSAVKTLSVEVRRRHVHVHETGNVAWFAAIEDVQFQTAEGRVTVNGLRSSGVMEKRADRWLVVQFHHSVGAAQQVVTY